MRFLFSVGPAMRARLLAAGLVSFVLGGEIDAGTTKTPYLQNVKKRGVTFMWETVPARGGVVIVEGNGNVYRFTSSEQNSHELPVEDLSPGTRYRYTVETGGESYLGEFATSPEGTAAFSFVVYGDSRSNQGTHTRVVERIRGEVPDFLLSTGDLVNDGANLSDWSSFFFIEGPLLRDNVLFPALGNHDRQGRGKTADNYRKYFSVPADSPNPERYYAFTYSNARFLVLDSNSHSFSLTEQTAWLEEQLQVAHADPKIDHIFVSMHHPPFSVSLHGGQKQLRELWTPLFEEYEVGAVFAGHDHVYSRAERHGVRYFVSGGGGAPLYPRKHRDGSLDEETNRSFERVNHYIRIHVFESLVEITAVRVDGSVIETVTYGEAPRKHEPTPTAEHEASMGIPALGAQVVAGRQPKNGLLGWFGFVLAAGAGLLLFASLFRSDR